MWKWFWGTPVGVGGGSVGRTVGRWAAHTAVKGRVELWETVGARSELPPTEGQRGWGVYQLPTAEGCPGSSSSALPAWPAGRGAVPWPGSGGAGSGGPLQRMSHCPGGEGMPVGPDRSVHRPNFPEVALLISGTVRI